jgi:hypothetical protein
VERFLGCAKMIDTKANVPSSWQGVNNISLGPSFGIEWLRRSTIEFTRMESKINPITQEPVTRSRDC